MDKKIEKSRIEIVMESGGDMPQNLANKYGIHVVPMHVTFGDESLDDGKFPVKKVFDYYDETGKLPQTSATNPAEYEEIFEKIHRDNPDCQILHLCYSAVTTATWQNALIASENMDYVTHIDTKNVSVGQTVVVLRVANYIKEHPQVTIQELIPIIEDIIKSTYMCFVPDTLLYLKAGGRVSNAAFMGASILNLHPVISIRNGKLVSVEKLRGSIDKVGKKLLRQFIRVHRPSKEMLYLIFEKENFSEESMTKIEEEAKLLGYEKVMWISPGCVISTHSGPGAFGIVGCKS